MDHEPDTEQAEEIRAIREALGVIAAAEPVICWVYRGEDDEWWMRREGDPEERSFPSRELALTAAQLLVARSGSYCLYVQGADGRITRSRFRWLPRQGAAQDASN